MRTTLQIGHILLHRAIGQRQRSGSVRAHVGPIIQPLALPSISIGKDALPFFFSLACHECSHIHIAACVLHCAEAVGCEPTSFLMNAEQGDCFVLLIVA